MMILVLAMDNYLLIAGAWGFTAAVFLSIAWWVGKLRGAVRYYLNKLEDVANGMSMWGDHESAKEYAQKLLKMTEGELEIEISKGRLINRWGKEIAATIEGLRASVPFLR
jgi:hypothetical protein